MSISRHIQLHRLRAGLASLSLLVLSGCVAYPAYGGYYYGGPGYAYAPGPYYYGGYGGGYYGYGWGHHWH
jgi:hypothetical protein